MSEEYWIAAERKRRQSGAIAGSMACDYKYALRYMHAIRVVDGAPDPDSVCTRHSYADRDLVQRPWLYEL
jgi:hypothetical protein